MIKIDPIIAVKDVQASADWYKKVFGFENLHGGDEFAVLVDKNNEISICLHKWGEHNHPSMENPNITPGNGLILYFRTENMEETRQNLRRIDYAVEEEVQLNPNSHKREFSIIDPNGYYLTISEFHKYES